MAKIYLFGKFMDPELRETSNGQTYLRFSIYSNHESVTLDVFEKRARTVNGAQVFEDDPRFPLVSGIKDGTPVMVLVNSLYSEKSKAIRYFLADIYTVEPAAQKAINSVLARKPISEVVK